MGIIRADAGRTVRIAYQGENKRQQVAFPLADIMEEFPGGTAVLAILRKGDTDPVPAAITEMDGTDLIWTVTAWECAKDDFIYAQITYAVDEVVAKTKTYRFDVKGSLIVSAAEPETWQDMVGQLVTAAAALQAAIDAYDAMTAEAEGLAAGSAPTAEIDHTGDTPVLKLGIPAGANGYSPSASVSKVGKKATITITDQQGTTTAEISDGTDGADVIDDTAGSGDTGKTWSADKIVGELGDKYEKPAGGIPATDLASAAQTSLGKADTAYQKPAGGIPATDLASGVIPDPTSIIDDTAGAGDTDKTFSADKLAADHSSLLSAIERKFGIQNVGDGLNVSEDVSTGSSRIMLNADVQRSDITNLQQNKADIIITNASGSIASISDGADDLPIEDMVVQIEPVQDLHGQSSPYPAGGGKNKLPDTANSGVWRDTISFTYENGVFSASGVASDNGGRTAVKTTSVALPAGTYYLKIFDETGTPAPTPILQNGSTVINFASATGEFTISEDASAITVGFNFLNGNTYNYSAKIAIATENITSYAPYSNICPISGWTGCNVTRCGKNLFNKTTVQSGYIDNSDGIQKGQSVTLNYRCTDYIYIEGGMSVYIKSEQSASMWGAWYDSEKRFISGVTNYANTVITAPSNARYVRLTIASNTTGNLDTFGVNYPATATAYEPYQGTTYPITFPSEAGTVYGGTVNPVTGELVVDTIKYRVPLLSESQITVASNNYIKADACDGFLYLNPPMNPSVGPQPLPYTPYCNMFSFGKNSIWSMTGYANCFTLNNGQLHLNIANDLIGVTDYTQETLATVRTKIVNYLNSLYNNGNYIEVCYKITPTTYTLTPTEIRTLLGTNNIWADTGDVSVEYRADTKLYVDRMSASGISDVKVNGSSVVTDGVANVPLASTSELGVARFTPQQFSVSSGIIGVKGITDEEYKAGTSEWATGVKPNSTHILTFYGLAKAAGDSTQKSSSNPIGTYTGEAKSKIQDMIGFGFHDIGTLTLETDSRIWNPNFETSVTEAIFIIKFKGTAQNTSEKPVSIQMLNSNQQTLEGVTATANYSARITGEIEYGIHVICYPFANFGSISGGASSSNTFSVSSILRSANSINISGLNLFTASGYYIGSGSTITMYAKY